MATIAENLQTLNETKQAIKAAIESKGQYMTDVPFTSYADKITAIESGEKERSLKKLLDVTKTCANMFYQKTYTDEEINSLFEYDDTENVTTMGNMFAALGYVYYLVNAPALNTSNVETMENMFRNQSGLKTLYQYDTSKVKNFYRMLVSTGITELPLFDTSSAANAQEMCNACGSLKIIPPLDFRNCENLVYFCNNAKVLVEIWIKNIKANIQVGSSSSWGHLLTQESALSLCFQCRNTGATKTITFAAPVFDNLATLYVKYVDITEEMRADDDLIDEKYPFVLCESTDEGAMTIATYMTNKMWAIARG